MLREIVLNLLHNLGGRAEVDRYLREYTGAGRYAVVKVGGGLIADDLEELASALVFMHHVGLTDGNAGTDRQVTWTSYLRNKNRT